MLAIVSRSETSQRVTESLVRYFKKSSALEHKNESCDVSLITQIEQRLNQLIHLFHNQIWLFANLMNKGHCVLSKINKIS